MNYVKKYLSIFAAVLGIGFVAYATNIPVQRFVVGPNDTQVYSLDDDGDQSLTGNLTVQSSMTVTGVSAFTGSVTANGTVSLSTTTFTGGVLLMSRTIAQLNTLTSGTTGQLILCSDCVRSAICVSSGTSNGAWVIAVATGTTTGTTFSGFAHCQ